MTQSKFDVMRALEAAVNGGSSPEGLVSEDVRIQNASTAVTDAVYEGVEGMLQWRSDLADVLEEGATFELPELIDAGDDRVVVSHRLSGRGSSSHAPVDLRWASVCWVSDGVMRRAVGYNTRREALAAAGLGQHVGIAFARALGAHDYDRVAAVLAPDVDFRGMTPNRFWEAHGPGDVVENVLREWLEGDDVRRLTVQTGRAGDRGRVDYRFELRAPDGPQVTEQRAYYSERDGRIDWLRVICSGARPDSS